MRTWLTLLLVIAYLIVLSLVIWAAELARPTMNARREIADDDEGY